MEIVTIFAVSFIAGLVMATLANGIIDYIRKSSLHGAAASWTALASRYSIGFIIPMAVILAISLMFAASQYSRQPVEVAGIVIGFVASCLALRAYYRYRLVKLITRAANGG